MRYFITFAYNGTDFHGSQTQPNGNTVQAELEAAFATILRQPVPLTFAGRTDAGVHAEQMVAHFDFDKPVPANLCGRLNNLLPASIAVKDIRRVVDDAHARFDGLDDRHDAGVVSRMRDHDVQAGDVAVQIHQVVDGSLLVDGQNAILQAVLAAQDDVFDPDVSNLSFIGDLRSP